MSPRATTAIAETVTTVTIRTGAHKGGKFLFIPLSTKGKVR